MVRIVISSHLIYILYRHSRCMNVLLCNKEACASVCVCACVFVILPVCVCVYVCIIFHCTVLDMLGQQGLLHVQLAV